MTGLYHQRLHAGEPRPRVERAKRDLPRDGVEPRDHAKVGGARFDPNQVRALVLLRAKGDEERRRRGEELCFDVEAARRPCEHRLKPVRGVAVRMQKARQFENEGDLVAVGGRGHAKNLDRRDRLAASAIVGARS